jgi:hypothetical protein
MEIALSLLILPRLREGQATGEAILAIFETGEQKA